MATIKSSRNRPTDFKGQSGFPKSPTIPGQDFTPQEIVRNFVQPAVKPAHFFSKEDLHKLQTMSKLDQLDIYRQLQSELVDGNDMYNELQKQSKLERYNAMIEAKAKELLDKKQSNEPNPTPET